MALPFIVNVTAQLVRRNDERTVYRVSNDRMSAEMMCYGNNVLHLGQIIRIHGGGAFRIVAIGAPVEAPVGH